MKVFDQHVGPMYIWSVALLILLAAAAMYSLGQFSYSFIAAVFFCIIAEIAINKYHHKRKIRIPVSGIITGLIIGSVAPYNVPLLAILAISLIAVLSKYFIVTKNGNVFNPAALGLLLGLAIFSIGDAWWTSNTYDLFGVALPLAFLLIISAYLAKRIVTVASFVIAILAFGILTGAAPLTILAIENTFLGINYLFAFLMLADPKTSPHKNIVQVTYGVGVALLCTLLVVLGLPYSLLIALLVANLCYFAYRRFVK